MRSLLGAIGIGPLLSGCLILLPGIALAQWDQGPIGVPGTRGDAPRICSDGANGAFLVWRDGRNLSTTDEDVFAQHLNAYGTVAPSWPDTGLAVCVAPFYQAAGWLLSDVGSGAYASWLDGRDYSYALYATKIADGGVGAPGWPTNGIRVNTGPINSFDSGTVLSDGNGGLFSAWTDTRSDVGDVYAEHFTPVGVVSDGWPSDGAPVCTASGAQGDLCLVRDGTGGILIAWEDGRVNEDTYIQHLTGAAVVVNGWPANGLQVAAGVGFGVAAASDDQGGIYVCLATRAPPYGDANYFIQRVRGDGTFAPGWPVGGLLVCDAPVARLAPKMVADGAGGVYMIWDDYRTYGGDVYAVRVRSNGTLAPGWPHNGLLVSTLPGGHYNDDLISDGLGGIYVSFDWELGISRPCLQHLSGAGVPAPGWSGEGLNLSPTSYNSPSRMATDDAGGVIMTWSDALIGIVARHVPLDIVTATQLTLISSDAQPDHVTLTWSSPSAATLTATVERRGQNTSWQGLGTPTVEGTDRLKFEDRTVTSGARYGYRLSYLDGTSRQYSSETWVEVPLGAVFALEGARPNPAVDHLSAAFSLADDSPASLTLLDVMGREMSRREVGSMGAGRHVVPLDFASRTPPGLYWIRLSQGARSLLARAVVIR